MLSSLFALALAAPFDAAGKERGNILFLMCDSMDGRVLDPTSDVSSRVEMKYFRGLAADGVNFVRTYAANPQCVPSRTTMFTGRHTHEIKAWSNSMGLAGDVLKGGDAVDRKCVTDYGKKTCERIARQQNVTFTMTGSLHHVGMSSHLFGKVDVGGGIMQENTHATMDGFHHGPDLTIFGRTANIERVTHKDVMEDVDDKDNFVHPEDWKMFPQCVDKIKEFSKVSKEDAAQWMLYCSVNIPHPAFQTNATWLAYVNDNVPLPAWNAKADFHPADKYMSISKNIWREFTDKEVLKVRRTYYAMCAETDFILGQVLKALDNHGFAENTWVVFLSDHGENNMEHRQILKNSHYEASSRVPMIIRPPMGMTGVRRGAVETSLTSLLDVLPTLVDMAQTDLHAGIKAGNWQPKGLDGLSVLPLVAETPPHGSKYPADRSVAAQYHANMGNTGSFMYRSGDWKYIAFGRGATDPTYTAQLFNVTADPDEVHDVAAAYPDVAASLDAALRKVIPYDAADAEARASDFAMFEEYFGGKSDAALRKKFASNFKGFDDNDWAKVKAWVASKAQYGA
eukprot:TRINITY_DN1790_c1_g3_i1.p1 TRINITY_DN1790_c1_g3~~TRINITY_DN1790_c1_g3_i1.p1  ORF type:complete len:567 (+),score=232.27 TRINITY_DN1790_c1_g3_i1:61-1761(+)